MVKSEKLRNHNNNQWIMEKWPQAGLRPQAKVRHVGATLQFVIKRCHILITNVKKKKPELRLLYFRNISRSSTWAGWTEAETLSPSSALLLPASLHHRQFAVRPLQLVEGLHEGHQSKTRLLCAHTAQCWINSDSGMINVSHYQVHIFIPLNNEIQKPIDRLW